MRRTVCATRTPSTKGWIVSSPPTTKGTTVEYESPLEAAWSEFGGQPLHPHHGWQKTQCVLHDERRPSATVNLETGKWQCFAGCGHGDLYDLIGLHEGLTEFVEQKAYADERGWVPEGEHQPEPSVMNPNPRAQKKGPKTRWKPSWL